MKRSEFIARVAGSAFFDVGVPTETLPESLYAILIQRGCRRIFRLLKGTV
jgi:hypothetical protein